MDDNDKDNQPGCCDGGQCCSSTPTDTGPGSARWKTLIFTAVLLLAGAVAAYSLFWRTPATPASCCPPGSAAASACGEAQSSPEFDHTTAPAGLSLLVLLHESDALSSDKMATISEVRAVVESHGEQLQVETVRSSDSAFAHLADQYRISAFPAIVVTGHNGVLILGNDQMRADTILSVFERTAPSTTPDSQSADRPL